MGLNSGIWTWKSSSSDCVLQAYCEPVAEATSLGVKMNKWRSFVRWTNLCSSLFFSLVSFKASPSTNLTKVLIQHLYHTLELYWQKDGRISHNYWRIYVAMKLIIAQTKLHATFRWLFPKLCQVFSDQGAFSTDVIHGAYFLLFARVCRRLHCEKLCFPALSYTAGIRTLFAAQHVETVWGAHTRHAGPESVQNSLRPRPLYKKNWLMYMVIELQDHR